jgi:hypothetical protein
MQHLVVVPYHPEANGLVERKNAEVMKHLRAMIFTDGVKSRWSMYLPLVQRLLNFTVDFSLGESPAKVVFGDMIATNVYVDLAASYDGVLVSDYLKQLKEVQTKLIEASRAHLDEEARKRDDKVPDEDAKSPIEKGDYVLMTYPARPPNKLASRYRGPLIVHEMERDDIVKVMDLVKDKVYEVHINRLHKLKGSEKVSKPELLRIAALDIDEYLVDKIMDHRGSKKAKTLKFRVRWEGYEPEDDTWEPWAEVKHLAALDTYLAEHPEVKV